MSIVIENIDHQACRLYSRGEGEISLEVISEHMLKRLDASIAAYGEILDLANATTNMSEQDIHRLAALRKGLDLPCRPGPTAVVTTNQVFYGMFRMYEMITDQIRPIMVFTELDPAVKWLDDLDRETSDNAHSKPSEPLL